MAKLKPPGREYRRMSKQELTERLHDLQLSTPASSQNRARELEIQAVLQELEVYQIELEMQNRELRESQQALEESQDRYLNLYDFAPMGYLTLTNQGLIHELNLTAAGMIGTERHWLVGRSFAPLVLGSDLAAFREHLKKCHNAGDSVISTVHIKRHDKHVFPAELSSTCVHDEKTGQLLFRTTLTDLTQRREAEAKLTFERYKLDIIFRDSPAAMALWRGPELVFEMVNPNYQAIFPGRKLIGKPLREALPELVDQGFAELLIKVMQSGETFVGHEVLAQIRPTEGGPFEERYYDFTYVPINDAHGRPYGVYDHALDVTERVLTRRALEAKTSEIQGVVQDLKHERELRERFVATLTHDLRTPLTAAKMNAQRLVHHSTDPAVLPRLSVQLAKNINRIEQMIQDLLDANRIQAGEKLSIEVSEFELTDLVKNTLETLTSIHGNRFVFNAPTPVRGSWSKDGLRRVIENLVTNAIKYGSTQHPITVSVVEDLGRQVFISVQNFGNPIAKKEQSTLFEQFRRSTSAENGSQKGWGIGLTLVRGTIEAHGGKVTVESDLTKGTTFYVVLPLKSLAA